MLASSEEGYQRAKAIKIGAVQLAPPFKELVAWLNDFYRDSGAIAAWLEPARGSLRDPALRIVLERDEALARFRDGANFAQAEQRRVVDHFVKLLGQLRIRDIDTERLFATFHSFEEGAREEALERVKSEDIHHLGIALADLDLWKIHVEFDGVVFFFNTDEELLASKSNGVRGICERAFASITQRYDEFGYLREKPLGVYFYSKERFDRVVAGNWYFFSLGVDFD